MSRTRWSWQAALTRRVHREVHHAADQERSEARGIVSTGNGCFELPKLPMSRLDIADYLGLTIETASRTLTQLENGGLITVPTSRRIVLRNRSVLNNLSA